MVQFTYSHLSPVLLQWPPTDFPAFAFDKAGKISVARDFGKYRLHHVILALRTLRSLPMSPRVKVAIIIQYIIHICMCII